MAAEGLHVLMEAMVDSNIFTGYNVGMNAPVSVSHLQFADDTPLMGTKSWANIRALRAVHVVFETIVEKIPFLYLGLSEILGCSENKSISMAEMWEWRRPLRAWEEEMLGECQTLLLTVSLQDHYSDRWQWQPDLEGGYTVRCAYHLLTELEAVPLGAAAGLIWHPQVPLKVSILAWRLLRDRLPTKANLITRAILPSGAHLCVSGCGAVESAQHLFLSCSMFGSLWSHVSSWIGSSLLTTQTLPDHFVQFTSSAGGSRGHRSFMQLIWLACVWVVWTERNHRLFRGSADTSLHMLDKIKTFSYR
ncbi:hypothetical protein TSUD_143230 [Trifolium subterraneum]|uniref:Reverse transcriptase zinc-binding domain-containing protein n=1 Tax=Trifolium subterraneum TaxID=3900 RepID=A0A2Z6NQ53_TRISU|nr:hypothetical protein TSUD_143230 [Trifolium subterraneum]